MACGLHGLLAAIDRGGFEAILIENHSQGIRDDTFIVGDEHSEPDSTVGGKSVHKTLAENEKTRVLCSEYIPGCCEGEFISLEVGQRARFRRTEA